MSQSVITFTNAAQWTASDSSLIEVAGGVGTLKAQTYANETFYAGYANDIDGNRGSGDLTGTAIGGASVADDKLNLKGGTLKYVSYLGSVAFPHTSVATVRLSYIPNFSGLPGGSVYIWTVTNGSGFTDVIEIQQRSDGKIWVYLYDQAGSIINVMASASVFTPVAGTEIKIELDLNLAGTTRLFVNGNEEASTTASGTRQIPSYMYVGTDRNATEAPNFEIGYVQIFSTVQNTTSFTPGSKPTTYSTSNPYLTLVTGIGTDSLDGFAESATVSGSDLVKDTLLVDDIESYWDGAAWSASSGYANSNSAAEIQTNKASLGISLGATIKPRVYLHTEYGETTPTITSLTIDYDFFAPIVSQDACKVYGYIRDGLSSVSKAGGYIRSKKPFILNGNIVAVNESITVNANGYFEIEVPRSSEKLDFKVSFLDGTGLRQEKTGYVVADVAEKEIELI